MGQRLLLSLPAVAAAIVAWAVLGAGGGRIRYVQVFGGPTRAASSLLLRALELDRDGRLVPSPGLALRARFQSGAASADIAGTTDGTGQLELHLEGEDPPDREPWLRVEATATAEVLAEGRLVLDPERWAAAARRSGGWLAGQTRGTLRVRTAAEAGTFAVPFEGALMVQVLEPPADAARASAGEEHPMAGARIQVELDGATLAGPAPDTAASGLSRVALRPDEHAVSARIVARAGELEGEWYGALPVTPGALAATREDSELVLRSPIARERAFASIVTRDERIAGAIVPLTMAEDGSASGRVRLGPALLARIEREPSWVVVSSEHDKRSAGSVGWPLTPSSFDPASPRRTFDVADALLLDGRAGAIHAAELERSSRRRVAAFALLAVGLLMSASFWRQVRRGTAVDSLPVAPRGWVFAVALGCIVLGLGGLAYFGLVR